MSLFRHRVVISTEDRDAECFSVNNFFVGEYNDSMSIERGKGYDEDVIQYDEVNYEYGTGKPICHVLEWIGNTHDGEIAFNQLDEMAARKRTLWRLENISIYGSGVIKFQFRIANTYNLKVDELGDDDYSINTNSDEFCRIILESRSDHFAVTRFQIVRRRSDGEAIITVDERTGSYFRHLAFHFPDNMGAYCDVAEYRR